MAENCDWGHASGPLGASDDRATGGLYNPNGQGDKVSNNVDYYPWVGCTVDLPATPTGLSSTPGNKAINLTWNANTEASFDGYKVYYGTAPGSYGAGIFVGKVTSYTITGLTNDTPYCISISARNSVGAESQKAMEIKETPINDQDAPVSTISDPANGDELSGETYVVRGTAEDGDGTGVKQVEVSTDGGQTWKLATGTTDWNYTWTLPEPGSYTLRSRATDNADHIETPGQGVTVTVVSKPVVVTSPASNVTLSSATLNGNVNPGGLDTVVVFEWGVSASYGYEASAIQSPLSGTAAQSVSADLTGLAAGETYHYRVKATNSKGTVYGEDQTFLAAVEDLAIRQTVNNMNPKTGDTVVLAISVTNLGPTALTDIQIIDVLPTGLSYVSDTSGGSFDPATGLWAIVELPPVGGANQMVLQITTAVTGAGEVLNIASIAGCGIKEHDVSNNSSAVLLNGGAQTDLGLSKEVSDLHPQMAASLTYTLTITNNGPDNATGIEVIDPIPTDFIYQGAQPSQGTYDVNTGLWAL